MLPKLNDGRESHSRSCPIDLPAVENALLAVTSFHLVQERYHSPCISGRRPRRRPSIPNVFWELHPGTIQQYACKVSHGMRTQP